MLLLDTEQTRTTGIMEMNKPEHPEGVEWSEPLHYPTPEELAEFKELTDKFSKYLKGEIEWSEVEEELNKYSKDEEDE